MTLLSAIQIWKLGEEITTDHWFQLAAKGYDLNALRARYFA